ncbi:HNH endonuclease [Flavobacterium sp. 9AF]|uniref:HNH endonuclease n=1 Tax=Flavobacterium sp. 9AF TaxID=2653142 RepID=UPI0012F00FBF|nr:HNH endonuclease [Flavobacterium sp. 9AF]VXB87536.1 HNH endonuclease [Flavobacterium sp. 9AF]
MNQKKCIWCLKSEDKVTFIKKAHTIPKSLGGQRFNKNVCDDCNEYFGKTTKKNGYSIEEALKETFCLSRQRFLINRKTKRQIGKFKSKFFDIKERNGKTRIVIKRTFLLKSDFQKESCINFKRGLVKMWFEEYDRQTNHLLCLDSKFDYIRNFARFNKYDIPILYFERNIGIFIMFERESETPILMFDRMEYLYDDDFFTEIEFLGHVFSIPKKEYSKENYLNYIKKSFDLKKGIFKNAILIRKLIDVDFTLRIIDEK